MKITHSLSAAFLLPVLVFLGFGFADAQPIVMGNGTATACSGVFTDQGGANGNYGNNQNFTLTINPSVTGNFLQINFTSFFTEANYDFLRIYDGTGTSAPLIGTYSGTNSPGLVSAGLLNPGNGSLTFSFTSDISVVEAGWQANIACINNSTAPSCAQNFSPANNSVGQQIVGGSLSWNAGFGGGIPTGYQVWFGPQGNLSLLDSNHVASNYQLPSLNTSSNYCYQIIPFNTIGAASACPVTCYTTSSSIFLPISNGSVSTCSGLFTDAGGSGGNYANNENFIYTIQPSLPGNIIQVNFQAFALENNFDFLSIYDGPNTSDTLIGTYTNLNSPGVITAGQLNPGNGSLTFRFTSDGSSTLAGWQASVICLNPNSAPACVQNQSPANQPVPSSILDSLRWETGAGGGIASGYQIWFGLAGNLLPIDTISSATSYALPDLAINNTYCYQIIPFNNFGAASACPVTCFTPVETILMANGSDTLCSGVFTDSGGPDGNYGSNELFTFTLHPGSTGNVLQMIFTSFNLEANYDSLQIFDGTDPSAPLIGSYTGTNSPGLVTAGTLNPGNGSLTFLFDSDGSVVRPGWTASISCVPDTNTVCLTPLILYNDSIPTCEGSVVTLFSSTSNNLWSTGDTTQSIDVLLTNDTLITVTNVSEGCSASSLPIYLEALTNSTTLVNSCNGYDWQGTYWTNSGVYTSNNGCGVDTLILNVLGLNIISGNPVNQTVNEGSNAMFVVGSSVNANYQWQTKIGSVFLNIADGASYSGTNNDTLIVLNTDASNNNQVFQCVVSTADCESVSDSAMLTVNLTVGSDWKDAHDKISFFPNPSKGSFSVVSGKYAHTNKHVLKICNPLGLEVFSTRITEEIFGIDLQAAAGIYFLYVGDENGQTTEVHRIVIQE